MNWQDIFEEFWTLYRGDSDIPTSTDDEWGIAIRLANAGIRRWNSVDGVLWNELWTNFQTSGGTTVSTGITTYDGPSDMRTPGGFIRLYSGESENYIKVLSPEEVQNQADISTYAYFTGDPNNGFVLNLDSGSVSADYNGWNIDFPYYKQPTIFDPDTEDGNTTPEMSEPGFIVNEILANRLRTSRNWPAYQTARRDADKMLQDMIDRNTMGIPFNSPTLTDPLGGIFGQ